jgi:general transcription factor 3C polypeptide 5 (transcription factor C subunit 1)
MNRLITGETPDPHLYDRILTWPEVWDDKTMYSTYRSEVWNPEIHKEKLKEHEVMHTVRWAARNPRWAFEKLEKRSEQGRKDDKDQEMAEEEEEVPEDATEVPETAAAIFNDGEPGPEPEPAAMAVAQEQDYVDDEIVLDEEEDEEGIWEADESDSDGPLAVEEPKGNKGPFGGLYR